jgi:D-alanyl-D-alanine carboxypeptidase
LGLAGLILATAVTGDADARTRHRRHHRAATQHASYDPPASTIVVDANTGAVLEATNPDALRHPASLTKMMTLYLLFERLQSGKLTLSSELPVSAHAAAQAPSKLGLKPGDSIRVETAIKAIVTKSANDVAVVIGEAIGGDEPSFARMMTAKAHALGMMHTNYHNASGLPDDAQVTTARDQAIIGRALRDRFPQYYHYFSTRAFDFRGRTVRGHNRLLGNVAGVDGIKTGYIRASGFNIVTSVHRGNRYIVAVVFGGRSARARDAHVESLIAQNFDKASTRRGVPAEGAQDIPVAKAEPKLEPVKAAAAPALAPFKTVDEAAAARNEVASIDAPQTGSTAPIRPNPVKTVVVHSATFRTASLSPPQPESNRLAPAPATARSTRVTDIATIKSDVPPLPPPPRARPGVLGTLPRVASASATVPLPAATTEAAAKHSGWMIQVGAFDDEKEAKQRLDTVQDKIKLLGKADPFTERVSKGRKSLYRARFAGLEKDQAEAACKHLKRSDIPCMMLKN